MASSKEVKDLGDHLKTLLKNIADSKSGGERGDSAVALLNFIYSKKPEEQATIINEVLHFALNSIQSNKQLFLFVESIIGPYYQYFLTPGGRGNSEAINKMINSFKEVVLPKIQSKEAVQILKQSIADKKPVSNSDFSRVSKTFSDTENSIASPASTATTSYRSLHHVGASAASNASQAEKKTAMKSHRATVKIPTGKELNATLEKCRTDALRERSKDPPMSSSVLSLLVPFYHKGVTSEQQKAMAERILLFAEHEIKNEQRLFYFTETFLRTYYTSFQSSSNFGNSAIINQMVKELNNICARNIHSEEAINVLNKTIKTGKAVDASEVESALKTFDKMINLNDDQNSRINKARNALVNNLKVYDRDLSGGKRHGLIQNALENNSKLSNDEFLVNFMIASRICESIKKPEDRKTVLLNIFPENDLFRPFAELFASSEIDTRAKKARSSLDQLFKIFERDCSHIYQDKSLHNQLDKAITDKLTESLIKAEINKAGDSVHKEHRLLRVLKNLIYAGQIDASNPSDEKSQAAFTALIEEFAANYYVRGKINPAEGFAQDPQGFLDYFSEIIAEVKQDTAKTLIGEENLNTCLGEMKKVADHMDFSPYIDKVDNTASQKLSSSTQPSESASGHRSLHHRERSSTSSSEIDEGSEKVSSPTSLFGGGRPGPS